EPPEPTVAYRRDAAPLRGRDLGDVSPLREPPFPTQAAANASRARGCVESIRGLPLRARRDDRTLLRRVGLDLALVRTVRLVRRRPLRLLRERPSTAGGRRRRRPRAGTAPAARGANDLDHREGRRLPSP